MTQDYVFRRTQRLPLPPGRVFEFFADAGNLEAITPQFLNFHIVTPTPIVMRPGALIEYRLRLFGVPFGWRTEIESYDPPRSFVDQQLSGPYSLWHHTHTFAPVMTTTGSTAANGLIETEMTDVVRYRLPLGPFGRLAHALFVRRTLATIFDYRRDRIAELIRA